LIRSAVLVAALVVSSPALAQLLSERGPPQHRVTHRNTLAVRVNPLGLLYEGRFSYRYRLYPSDSVVLRDNFFAVGISPGASPAFGRIGFSAELQPLTILGLWMTYEFMPYFGSINLFQSFPNASADFSDTAIRNAGKLPAGDPARPYPTVGAMLTLGANLNLKLGPVIVRSLFRAYRPDFKMRPGDTTLYDQTTDLLMGNQQFALTNDLDVILQLFKFGLLIGARYSFGIPLYGPENFSELGPVDNSTHRLGPFVAYRFFDKDGAGINQPTVALVANWWLRHPMRTGRDVPQGIPYLALAFNMVGDLLPLPPVEAKKEAEPAKPDAPAVPPPAPPAP
jgi:hypothetical protein